MSELKRYIIKGKTYRKVGEEPINDDDRCIVDAIWSMTNHKGEQFRLMVREGRSSSYRLYTQEGKFVCSTYSIRQVT
jgi:hypothetical protein